MKKLILTFFLVVFCSQAKYNIVDFVLNNGLRIVFIEKKTAPIIFFSIWYKCGSQYDAISKSGVAHYLEHMAFCSNRMKFSNFLEDIGASKNAFTSINTICFHEIVPKENIEDVFIHEAERMRSLNVDDKTFLSEKKAILEERSMRIDNNPEGACYESVLSNIFNREIGGIGIIGWKHEIESIKKEDLYSFHGQWFAPNNAIIVISGDFELSQIKTLAQKYFEKIPPKELPKIPIKNSSPVCLREIKYSSPKNGEISLVKYIYRVPFSSKENFRKTITFDIAIKIINRPAFFIIKMLKDVLNSAIDVKFDYESRVFSYDVVILEISSNSIDNLRHSEDIWDHLKNKLARIEISKPELDTVKRQYLISLAYTKDDIREMSNQVGWLLMCGYSVGEIQSMDDIVQSISEKECTDVLREVFSMKPVAIARNVPKGYDHE
ncbi:MAG: insulinase family protein [Holosporaceae bacterium]|nr:insulinase family protein [Holosporaceae bacterium]